MITSLVFTPTSWNPNFDESIGRYPYNRILGANPLDVIENWRAPEEVTRFLGSIEGTWRPRDDLTIRYLAGVDDYRREYGWSADDDAPNRPCRLPRWPVRRGRTWGSRRACTGVYRSLTSAARRHLR